MRGLSASTAASRSTFTITLFLFALPGMLAAQGLESISVTSPNGGESWEHGSVQAITWTTQNMNTGSVSLKIELYKGGSFLQTVDNGVINDGVWGGWTIPASLEVGSDYKVKIVSLSDAAVNDLSDGDFSITVAVLFIDKDNTSGTEDGLTWATAFTTVQEGIDAALAGSEVWVAEGVYDEARTSVNPDGSGVDTGSIVMARGVSMYGGFNGTELIRKQRNWKANPTVLDGFTARGGQPAYHVVVGADATIFDGFIVTGGHADADAFSSDTAGGGSGMLNKSISMRIARCVFTGNSIEGNGRGAGVNNVSVNNVQIWDSFFVSNFAPDSAGTGLNNADSTNVTVDGCIFLDNSAVNGAAIFNERTADLPRIVNSLFVGNHASQNGSAIHNQGPGGADIANCTFSGNQTPGGTINSNVNEFVADLTVWNCILSGNSGNEITPSGASTISVSYSNVQGGYSGEGNIDSDPLFVGGPMGTATSLIHESGRFMTTLTDNSAPFRPGALVGAVLWVGASPDDVAYYITANNSRSITVWADVTEGGTVTAPVNYSVVDYRLSSVSPCIDTGTAIGAPPKDILNVPRGINGDGFAGIGSEATGDGSEYDMGAYEFTVGAPTNSPWLAEAEVVDASSQPPHSARP